MMSWYSAPSSLRRPSHDRQVVSSVACHSRVEPGAVMPTSYMWPIRMSSVVPVLRGAIISSASVADACRASIRASMRISGGVVFQMMCRIVFRVMGG